MTEIMRGLSLLRRYTTEFLAAGFPDLLDVFRDLYGLDEYTLPTPKKYDAEDPMLVDVYPAIGVVFLNDRGHTRNGYSSPGEQHYAPRYNMRFFVAAKTPQLANGKWEQPEKDTAIRVRDDLTRLLHHLILESPGMGHPDRIEMDETTMTTDYLEPVLPTSQSRRLIAISIVTIEVSFDESTIAQPIGVANAFTVSVDKNMEEQ